MRIFFLYLGVINIRRALQNIINLKSISLMKKAKLFLTVIAILSITGGALAYKASRISTAFYLDTVTTTFGGGLTSVCTVLTYYNLITNPGGVRTIAASTAPTYTRCPVISVIVFA